MAAPMYGQDYPGDAWVDRDGTVYDAPAPEPSDEDQAYIDSVMEDDLAQRRAAPTAEALNRPRPHLRTRLLTLTGLGSLPPVHPLVDGLVYRGTLAQISGPPGSYKSFVSVGLACSVAAGVNFEDHRVPDGGGPVVYVAAEGATGLRSRILAWCELTNVDPAVLEDRLYVLPLPVQLGNVVDVSEAIEITKEVGARLLILDTRARCTLGLEENSATEQGRAIAALEAVVMETGCAVLAVHHSGRNGAAGRGSTAWDGAVWSDLRLTGEELRSKIVCHKHKDVESGCEHEFKLVPHTVSPELMPGIAEKMRSTLVAVQGDFRATTTNDPRSIQVVHEVVQTCDGPQGLSRTEIVNLVEERQVSRSQAYEAIKRLDSRGSIRNVGTDKQPRWVVPLALIPEDPNS